MTIVRSEPLTSWDRIATRGVRVGTVDAVGLEARAARLATRSIKRDAKAFALDLAIRCTDLTTLEGADTPGRVRSLCAKARRPDPVDATVPPVAAVCVYPTLVPTAHAALDGSPVRVASVAGAFPSGQSPPALRLAEIRWAVDHGADEIDIVLDRGAFLSGRYQQVFDDVAAAKQACGSAHLKTILETGELGGYDQVRRAAVLAMAAGSDTVKTSTGKIDPAATLPVALCLAEAIRDFHRETGRVVGLKVAGGIRSAKQAWHYLVVVHETLGPDWLDPAWLRIGASSLLNDLLMQRARLADGRYHRPDDFTRD